MKKWLKSILTLAAVTTAFGFFASCGGGSDDDSNPQGGEVERVITNEAAVWTVVEIPADKLALAKPGAKVIFKVSNNTQNPGADDEATYCKTLVMNGSWDNPGVDGIYGPDGNTKTTNIEDTTGEGGATVHRPYAEGEGVWYFYLTEGMLGADKIIFSGCFTMEYCDIEYIGGKKTITPYNDAARPEIGEVVYNATGEALTINLPVNHYDDADHGVQFTADLKAILPKGAIADESYKIVLKGTSDGEFSPDIQFVNSGWTGITGEGHKPEFTEGAFNEEFVLTFSEDASAGSMFQIADGTSTLTAKTLTCTEFTVTRVALAE